MLRSLLTAVCLSGGLPLCLAEGDAGAVLRGAAPFRFDPRLGELFEKIDPAKAGWHTEVFQDAALAQLHTLFGLIEGEGERQNE